MIEIKGDLWEVPADARVVTTNGIVKNSGELVMGKGVALTAKKLYPEIDKFLGELVVKYGNHSHMLSFGGELVASMPTKHHWRDPSDPELIVRSAKELVAHANEYHLTKVVLPRPGCGNGQLSWHEVQPLVRPILDARFYVVSY